jgi:hypothetical protein
VAIDLAGKKATRSLTVSSKKDSVDISSKGNDFLKIGSTIKNSLRKLTSSSILSLSSVWKFEPKYSLNILPSWSGQEKLKLSVGTISFGSLSVIPAVKIAKLDGINTAKLDKNNITKLDKIKIELGKDSFKGILLGKELEPLDLRIPNIVIDNSRFNVIY